jgi:hypothetical protein
MLALGPAQLEQALVRRAIRSCARAIAPSTFVARGKATSLRESCMAHVVTDKDTRATPQEVIGALTDFSDRRLELWPNIDRKYYKVHQVSRSSADVTEGSGVLGGVWERTHYDWSEPGKVHIRVEDSNAFRPGSSWSYSVEPRPDGGSHVHLEFLRRPRNAKGVVLSALFSVAGRKIFGDFLEDTLHRLERRRTATGAPSTPESTSS